MTRRKRSSPGPTVVTLSQDRALSSGSVWTLNLYKPQLHTGVRLEIRLANVGESPLPAADRILKERGLKVDWTEHEATGHYAGLA